MQAAQPVTTGTQTVLGPEVNLDTDRFGLPIIPNPQTLSRAISEAEFRKARVLARNLFHDDELEEDRIPKHVAMDFGGVGERGDDEQFV